MSIVNLSAVVGCATILAILAILLLRDARASGKTPYALAAIVTSIAVLFSHLPNGLQGDHWWKHAAELLHIPNLPIIWWAGLAIFNDRFRPGLLEWAGMVSYVGLKIIAGSDGFGFAASPIFTILTGGISFAMMAHLIVTVLSSRGDDLVESRRNFRQYFVMALAVLTIVVLLTKHILSPDRPEILMLIKAASIGIMGVWALLWLTHLSTDTLEFKKPAPRPELPPKIDPRDEDLLQRLKTVMNDDAVFKQPRLTIRSLAARLKTPEHRLRHIINQGLGHRNFSEFVNGYRIDAVKSVFADPKNARTPILTIALDAGYNSLAPFNRAFKAATGLTPSAYRAGLFEKNNSS